MPGAEDERTGQIAQTAGAMTSGHWLEYARIGTGVAQFAGPGICAMRDAGNLAKDNAQGTAQNVRGLAGWKEQ